MKCLEITVYRPHLYYCICGVQYKKMKQVRVDTRRDWNSKKKHFKYDSFIYACRVFMRHLHKGQIHFLLPFIRVFLQMDIFIIVILECFSFSDYLLMEL